MFQQVELGRWSSTRIGVAPMGRLALSEDVFVVHDWGAGRQTQGS